MRRSPVMIVENDPNVVNVLRLALRREGIARIALARDGGSAVATASDVRPSVVVLDIDLPDCNGLELASRLRIALPDVPLIFLTARDSDADKLEGFRAGADDYVTKPFNPLELAARIKAVVRRVEVSGQPPVEFDFGRFTILPQEGRLAVDGQDVPTPARELELLTFLASQEGRIFSANELYRRVWNAEPVGHSDQNTVSVHVRRIRERIERDPATPEYLLTARGLGYKLTRPKRDAAAAARDTTRLTLESSVGLPTLQNVVNALDQLAMMLHSGAAEPVCEQQAREDWVMSISHDLKSPLIAIEGLAQLVAAGEFTGEGLARIGRAIVRHCENMEMLVGDLDTPTRIRSGGRILLARASVDLVALVRNIVTEQGLQSLSAGCDVRQRGERSPVIVNGDEQLLRRAITNVVADALAHDPRGTTVTVSVALGEDVALIIVDGDGKGYDPECAHTFSAGVTLSALESLAALDRGVGIDIARQFIAAHDGRLSIDGSRDRGTRIELEIPLEAIR